VPGKSLKTVCQFLLRGKHNNGSAYSSGFKIAPDVTPYHALKTVQNTDFVDSLALGVLCVCVCVCVCVYIYTQNTKCIFRTVF